MIQNTTIHRHYWMAVASMALLMAIAVGCQRTAPPVKSADAAEKKPAKVLVGIAREKTLRQTIDLPAVVESDETAMLMTRVEAYVGEVLVDIGDEVQKGQVLIRLDAPELLHQAAEQRAMIGQLEADGQVLLAEVAAARTQLDVVRAKLRLKNSERDRLERLVNTGAIERQRLEEAESSAQSVAATLARYENGLQVAQAKLLKGKSEMAVAESKLQAAEALASYLEIKAPFSGVVARRDVDSGNLVRPANQGKGSKPLLVIEKLDRLRAIMHATSDVAGQLSVGDQVTFLSDDKPNNPIHAEISRTSGSYDERTRMMRAEIDIDNSPDSATGQRPMRSGSYGSAKIVLREETLPVVPESALLHRNGVTSVVVIRNEVCQITPVEIAMESEGLVGIRSGVGNGDLVVFENPDAIQPGQTLLRSQTELVP